MSEVAEGVSRPASRTAGARAGGGEWRLPAPEGAWIERAAPVEFQFEGRHYTGFRGDTIASALAAHGVRLLGRSFKYHRPRGVLTLAGQDANTLVQLADEPSVRADTRAITPGLVVHGQNYSGSLARDRRQWIEPLGRFLPVGFYYKAFYRPQGAWRRWAPIIRRFAGLGKVNQAAEPVYRDKAYCFADVAIIGGGPAGLSAALEAARTGAEVVLIEENPYLGGALNYARFDVSPDRGTAFAEELIAAVSAQENIRVLTGAVCTGWFADNFLAVLHGARLLKLRSRAVVLASGSIEQPIVFRNNDLPGVMQASAAQRLIRLYGVRPGNRAVIATANADGYGAALDCLEAGVEVAAVVDLRATPPSEPLSDAIRDHGIRILAGSTPFEALPGSGKRAIDGVVVDAIEAQGRVAGRPERFECDLLLMSPGYTPAAQLACHAGGRLVYDEALAMLRVEHLPSVHAVAAGSVNATFALDAVRADGRHAGARAAEQAGFDVAAPPPPANSGKGAEQQNHPWPIFPHPRGKDFVDFDEDLQVHDILDAIHEGYDDLELVKRYSTAVMGPSQGRHSALSVLRLTCRETERPIDGATLTTQRPPFQPEPIGHLAGRSFQPRRLTAMHAKHLAAGAQMMPAGAWLRPAYYGSPAQRDQAIADEARAVREKVGLIDVSTLGGLEIRGPDAAEFMNRIYTFAYVKQPVGRSRYILVTDATGAIIDDGVACRFGEQHFYVTATSSGVDALYRMMLRYNAEWRLDVDVANVTAAYAAVNVAGPDSRAVVEAAGTEVDVSKEAFPYLEVRTGAIAGIPARWLRVGFVGELGYEIHVPASQGEALWEVLVKAGEPYGIRPFGVEAQRLLRLEKGHLIVGQDTDGLTFPHEANMAWAIAKKKPFFVGQRAIAAQAGRALTRQLVGFTLPTSSPLPEECNLTVRDNDIVGRVTSVSRSETCGNIIGLAFVAPEQAEPGGTFEIKLSSGERIGATVTALPFYDPDNARQEL